MRRLGLEPAGDGGSYFQAIPWVTRRPDPDATLHAGDVALSADSDFLVLPRVGLQVFLGGQPYGGSFKGEGVATVYGGRIGDSTLIAPEAARGKVVVFAPPADRPAFAFWQRDNLRRYSDATALLVATLDLGAPAAYRSARDTYWDSTGSAGLAPMTVVSITAAAGAKIFRRPLDGLTVGATGLPLNGRVGFVDVATEAPAYNVVGILRGRDARFRGTYVAVGAHHDHIGFSQPVDHDSIRAFNAVVRVRGADDPPPRQVSPEQWTRIRTILDSLRARHGVRLDSINNGADDDGSGTVLALEIAEALATAPQKPRRSVIFVFHTAEEKGLYGAQYFSDHPTVPRDSVVAQVNMDQMGRGDPEDDPPGGPNALVVIGSRRLSTELGDLAETVNRKPEHGFKLDYQFDRDGDPTRAYCRSDHYMYARYGIPVVFYAAAAWYRDYHMVSDEPQYIAYERMTRIGRYIRDMVASVADLDHRPVVDKIKPDPNGTCRQ